MDVRLAIEGEINDFEEESALATKEIEDLTEIYFQWCA